MLSYNALRAALHYDPATGIWTWLQARPGVKVGQRADVARDKKYRRINWDYCHYYSHRLAWFYMTDSWPSRKIDHENLDGWDNSWSNLRLADNTQNGANRGLNKNNTTGIKGVYWNKERKKWQAYICVNYHCKSLGRFSNLAAAVKARQVAAETVFGEFARHA